MAAHLAQEAGTLAQNWSGVAARTALAQLQRLHQQTATLATQVTRTGAVLTWLGTQVLPALNHPATPTQARQFLTHLTTALTQADNSLPTITAAKGTTSPGVTSRHPVPTPPGRSGISITRRPASTTNPAGLAHTSHSSPLSLVSITSHSGQGSPAGTPLMSGSTHPAAPISSLQSAPVPTPAATAPATAGPAPAAAPGPAPTPGPIALTPVPPTPGSTTAAASSESATATPRNLRSHSRRGLCHHPSHSRRTRHTSRRTHNTRNVSHIDNINHGSQGSHPTRDPATARPRRLPRHSPAALPSPHAAASATPPASPASLAPRPPLPPQKSPPAPRLSAPTRCLNSPLWTATYPAAPCNSRPSPSPPR